MNVSKETKKSLEKVLEKSCDAITGAIDSTGKLIKENAKDIALEVIVFKGLIENVIGMVWTSVVTGVLIKLTFYLNSLVSSENHGNDGYYFGMAACIVGSIILSCLFFCTLTSLLKAKFAPRVFLLEYAADLLKPKESEGKK